MKEGMDTNSKAMTKHNEHRLLVLTENRRKKPAITLTTLTIRLTVRSSIKCPSRKSKAKKTPNALRTITNTDKRKQIQRKPEILVHILDNTLYFMRCSLTSFYCLSPTDCSMTFEGTNASKGQKESSSFPSLFQISNFST